jgi:hypothetical protein
MSFCILLFVLIITGCSNSTKKHTDPFYDNPGTYDSLRLPLINPYYLVQIDKQHGWQMPLKGNLPQEQYYYNLGDLLDIQQIAVESDVIMVYTPYLRKLDTNQANLNWFVVIPKNKNFEIGFSNENDFLIYIKNLGIDLPKWIVPDIAYKEFLDTNCLNWIPDCN